MNKHHSDLSLRQRFTHLKTNRESCVSLILVGAISIVLQPAAHGTPLERKKLNSICRLTINGKTYLDGPCKYEHSGDHKDFDYFKDDRVAISCQANGSGPCYVTNPGVFGYLTPSPKGDAKLCWNEMSSAHAQTCFLGLIRAGACWINPAAKGLYSSQLEADIKFCAWAR